MSNKLNWVLYQKDLDLNNIPGSFVGAVLMASIRAKNGYTGTCWICRNIWGDYELIAGSDTTGKNWKAPQEHFQSIKEAKLKAETLWLAP